MRILLAVLVLTAPSVLAAFPVPADDDAFARALEWLRARTRPDGCIAPDLKGTCNHATTRDALIALSASGEDPRRWSTPSPVDFLRSQRAQLEAESGACPACGWAKTIVALGAAQEDPRTFGGFDYVARLDGYFDGVQMGEARQVNDDAWALYAYSSLDEADASKVDALRRYVAARQGPTDGGWSWSLGASEPWGTATVLLALLETGTQAQHESVARAIDYLKGQLGPNALILQDGADSAESTAIALQAIRRAGRDPTGEEWTREGRDPVEALLSLQGEDGSFAHNAQGGSRFLATTQTLPGLRGVPFPFRPPTVAVAQSPAEPVAASDFELRALVSDADGVVETFEWRVDGEPAGDGAVLRLRFEDAGKHRARLSVTDDDGVRRSIETDVAVAAAPQAPETPTTDASDPTRSVASSEPIAPLEEAAEAPGPTWIVPVATALVIACAVRRRR